MVSDTLTLDGADEGAGCGCGCRWLVRGGKRRVKRDLRSRGGGECKWAARARNAGHMVYAIEFDAPDVLCAAPIQITRPLADARAVPDHDAPYTAPGPMVRGPAGL